MNDRPDKRDKKLELETLQKARAKALRGKIGFAKAVWKHFNMDTDLFN